MAVYYKFKSAKDFYSIPIKGQFISVGSLKEAILNSNRYGKGKDFDLMISNAQTNEEYTKEAAMIPENSSVIIRRLSGIPLNRSKVAEEKLIGFPPTSSNSMIAGSCFTMVYPKEFEWDIADSGLLCNQEVPPAHSNSLEVDTSPANKDDEDRKIKALVNTPALDWNSKGNYFSSARRFPGRSGSMMPGYGFGHCGLEKRTPPTGYVCHRCNLKGHFIKHCPTNGDPDYDIKRLKRPIGIPKSMLEETPTGTYALPDGTTFAMKPNEAAFEKEVEGLSSTSCAKDIPPELWCPLCKEVMKDCVISGKCCFESYCDKCIRTYIISKSKCFCGATNILADYLIPNITIREAINRMLVSGKSSTEKSGSLVLVQDQSEDVKEPESATHSMLAKKQSEKCTIDPLKESLMPMIVEETPTVKKVSEVEKKKRKERETGYNEYNWAGFLPALSEECIPPLYAMNAWQCYYYNQSNWDTAGMWMNGVSINHWLPPDVGKAGVKGNPDFVQNEFYHKNRDESFQRNRRVASASGNVNDSLFKAEHGMMSQVDRADQAVDKCVKATDKDLHDGPSRGAGLSSSSQGIEKSGCDKVLGQPYQSSLTLYCESSDEEERHFKRRKSWSKGSD